MNAKAIIFLFGLFFTFCHCEKVYKIDYELPNTVLKTLNEQIISNVKYNFNNTQPDLNISVSIITKNYLKALQVENGTSQYISGGIIRTDFNIYISGYTLIGNFVSYNNSTNYTGKFKAFPKGNITFPIIAYYDTHTKDVIFVTNFNSSIDYIIGIDWKNCPFPRLNNECQLVKNVLEKTFNQQYPAELEAKINEILFTVSVRFLPGEYPEAN